MIIDHISNASLYFPMGDAIKHSLDFLLNTDLSKLTEGRYDIDGDNAFALVQVYDTKPLEESVFEAHKQFVDIQYMVEGEEYIGYGTLKNKKVIEAYSEENDCVLYRGETDLIKLTVGMFAILYPQDLHMPRVSSNGSTAVKKIVVKVKL